MNKFNKIRKNETQQDIDIKFESYFVRLFPKIILENQIVSTILFVVLEKMKVLNKKFNQTLNEDI